MEIEAGEKQEAGAKAKSGRMTGTRETIASAQKS